MPSHYSFPELDSVSSTHGYPAYSPTLLGTQAKATSTKAIFESKGCPVIASNEIEPCPGLYVEWNDR